MSIIMDTRTESVKQQFLNENVGTFAKPLIFLGLISPSLIKVRSYQSSISAQIGQDS